MFSALFRPAPTQPQRHAASSQPKREAPSQLTLREADGVQPLRIAAGQTLRIQVQQGALWLTEAGKQQDRVLQTGQAIELSGPAQLALGAFGPVECGLQLRSGEQRSHADAPAPRSKAARWSLRTAA